jgi:hypothetical protein
MQTYREVEVQSHIFLSSALIALPLRNGTGTHRIGDWADHTAGLNCVAKKNPAIPEVGPRASSPWPN